MRRLIVPLTALAILAGCGSSDGPTLSEPAAPATTLAPIDEPTPTVPAISESAAREVAPEPELAVEPELSAEQILTATVLIASGGDLEAAITAGLIGEAEAEAALTALESGSIDDLLGE